MRRPILILVALLSLATPSWAFDKLVSVYSGGLPANAQVLSSRNGSAVVVESATGTVLIRNLLQFDQVVLPLPGTLRMEDVMAVSYYGRVYARAPLGEGCVVQSYGEDARFLSSFSLSDDSTCEIVSGRSNVTERFIFNARDRSGRERLILMAPGAVTTLWDSQMSALINPKLEAYSINDLNTTLFTLSHEVQGRRICQTWLAVPGRATREILFPKKLQGKPVVLDVNNRNQFLVRSSSGVWIFDPVRKILERTSRSASRLAPNGRAYAPTQISDAGSRVRTLSCFAKDKLGGLALQLLAVNEERELVMVGRGRTVTLLAKITPLSEKGFPGC